MRKAFIPFLALGLALSATGALCAAAEKAAGEAEVDLSDEGGAPTAVPTSVPTPAPTAAPTAEPTAVPTPAPSAVPTPEPTAAPAKPAEDLNQVRFDQGKPSAGGEEDGLILIAPGGASPEDTLESFGIDSPFNWKERTRRTVGAPAEEGEEALELTSPETSELKERVKVETAQGAELPGESDYDLVERAGGLLSASEYNVDGRLVRAKAGQYFSKRGNLILIKMEPGRQVYPGTLFTTFQDHGLVNTSGGDQREIGSLVVPTGVVRVTRIEGEEVQARVEKQYQTIREGDLVRLRDPEKQRYYATLRQGPATASPDLAGEVAAVPPGQFTASKGQMVYLSVGRAQGLVPGMRLTVSRDPADLPSDGLRKVEDTGRTGLIQVVAVHRYSATARVLKSSQGLARGDRLRYR